MRGQKRLFLALGLNAALVWSLAGVVGTAPVGRSGIEAATAAGFRVERRDLRDYDEATGTVARAEEFRVLHQASAAQPGPAAVLPNAELMAQYRPVSPSPTSTSTPTPAPSATTAASPSASASPSPSVERTVTAPPVLVPVPGPTVTVTVPSGVAPQIPQPVVPAPQASRPAAPDPRLSSIPTSQAGRATPPPGTGEAPAPQTVTAIASIGSRVKTGSRLYSVDDEPVIAIVSTTTLWRELNVGVSPGPDVEVLEKALQQLGFADELKVDREFTAATADAVASWEKKLGRSKNDGRVSLGEVVSIPSETEVSQQLVPVGGSVQSLTPVLDLAAQNFIIKIDIAPESSADWPPGTSVELSVGQERKFTGKIDTQDRSVTAENLQLRVLPGKETQAWKTGTQVRVVIVREIRKQILCVPVSFPRANSAGKPVVRVRVSGQVVERPVTLGLVADGWVQISGDFTENQELAN